MTSDVICGLRPNNDNTFDMFFIPTVLIQYFGTKSKGLGKLEFFKNNYDILENCKNHQYCIEIAINMNII